MQQTAYQIRVSSAITGKIVFDTKRVESSQSQLISVSLGNGFYTWQVRVWDKNGKPSAWSKKAEFAVQDNAAAFGNAPECVAIRLLKRFKFLETLVAGDDEDVVGLGDHRSQFVNGLQRILGIVFQLLTFLTE